jgi:[ribosomal protein S18]-alanine N-acetyltransferase
MKTSILDDYEFSPMSQEDAIAVATWHYEEPDSFYNADRDAEDLADLLDDGKRRGSYYSVRDSHRQLIGFFAFKSDDIVVTIGLGLRSDRTGQGNGLRFVRAGLRFGTATFAPSRFRLLVAAFNQRAIRVYERAGFRHVRTVTVWTNGGNYEFVELALDLPPPGQADTN